MDPAGRPSASRTSNNEASAAAGSGDTLPALSSSPPPPLPDQMLAYLPTVEVDDLAVLERQRRGGGGLDATAAPSSSPQHHHDHHPNNAVSSSSSMDHHDARKGDSRGGGADQPINIVVEGPASMVDDDNDGSDAEGGDQYQHNNTTASSSAPLNAYLLPHITADGTSTSGLLVGAGGGSGNVGRANSFSPLRTASTTASGTPQHHHMHRPPQQQHQQQAQHASGGGEEVAPTNTGVATSLLPPLAASASTHPTTSNNSRPSSQPPAEKGGAAKGSSDHADPTAATLLPFPAASGSDAFGASGAAGGMISRGTFSSGGGSRGGGVAGAGGGIGMGAPFPGAGANNTNNTNTTFGSNASQQAASGGGGSQQSRQSGQQQPESSAATASLYKGLMMSSGDETGIMMMGVTQQRSGQSLATLLSSDESRGGGLSGGMRGGGAAGVGSSLQSSANAQFHPMSQSSTQHNNNNTNNNTNNVSNSHQMNSIASVTQLPPKGVATLLEAEEAAAATANTNSNAHAATSISAKGGAAVVRDGVAESNHQEEGLGAPVAVERGDPADDGSPPPTTSSLGGSSSLAAKGGEPRRKGAGGGSSSYHRGGLGTSDSIGMGMPMSALPPLPPIPPASSAGAADSSSAIGSRRRSSRAAAESITGPTTNHPSASAAGEHPTTKNPMRGATKSPEAALEGGRGGGVTTPTPAASSTNASSSSNQQMSPTALGGAALLGPVGSPQTGASHANPHLAANGRHHQSLSLTPTAARRSTVFEAEGGDDEGGGGIIKRLGASDGNTTAGASQQDLHTADENGGGIGIMLHPPGGAAGGGGVIHATLPTFVPRATPSLTLPNGNFQLRHQGGGGGGGANDHHLLQPPGSSISRRGVGGTMTPMHNPMLATPATSHAEGGMASGMLTYGSTSGMIGGGGGGGGGYPRQPRGGPNGGKSRRGMGSPSPRVGALHQQYMMEGSGGGTFDSMSLGSRSQRRQQLTSDGGTAGAALQLHRTSAGGGGGVGGGGGQQQGGLTLSPAGHNGGLPMHPQRQQQQGLGANHRQFGVRGVGGGLGASQQLGASHGYSPIHAAIHHQHPADSMMTSQSFQPCGHNGNAPRDGRTSHPSSALMQLASPSHQHLQQQQGVFGTSPAQQLGASGVQGGTGGGGMGPSRAQQQLASAIYSPAALMTPRRELLAIGLRGGGGGRTGRRQGEEGDEEAYGDDHHHHHDNDAYMMYDDDGAGSSANYYRGATRGYNNNNHHHGDGSPFDDLAPRTRTRNSSGSSGSPRHNNSNRNNNRRKYPKGSWQYRLYSVWDRLKATFAHPSIPLVTTMLAIAAVVVTTVCTSIISETLFRTAMEEFASTSAEGVASGVAMDVTHFLQQAARSADGVQFATLMGNRMIPTDEEALTVLSQPVLRTIPNNLTYPTVITPEGEYEVYNGGEYKTFDMLRNTTDVYVNTWREFYLSQLSSIERTSNYRYGAIAVGFEDGTGASVNSDKPSSVGTDISTGDGLRGNDGIYVPFAPGTNWTIPNEDGLIRLSRAYDLNDTTGLLVGDRIKYRRNQYDPRRRPWYTDTPNELYSKRWTDFNLQLYPTQPVVSLTAPLWNNTQYIGKLLLSLELTAMGRMLLGRKKKTMGSSEVFLVSKGFIVASSMSGAGGRPITRGEEVERGYVLTPDDIANKCQLSLEEFGDITRTQKLCPQTVDSYGFGPLQDLKRDMPYMLVSKELDGGTGNGACEREPQRIVAPVPSVVESLSITLREMKSSGSNYYAVSIPLHVGCSANMDWVLVTIIPKDEITRVFSDVRGIVIGVTIGFIVVIAVSVSVALKYSLRSLGDVAGLMTTAAYLRDIDAIEAYLDAEEEADERAAAEREGYSGSSVEEVAAGGASSTRRNTSASQRHGEDSSSGPTPEMRAAAEAKRKKLKAERAARNAKRRQRNIAAMEKLHKQLSLREESRWAEVAAIQRAYWAMSDELQTLKAYIPEHLKEEVLTMHRRRLWMEGFGGSSSGIGGGGAGGSASMAYSRALPPSASQQWGYSSLDDGVGYGNNHHYGGGGYANNSYGAYEAAYEMTPITGMLTHHYDPTQRHHTPHGPHASNALLGSRVLMASTSYNENANNYTNATPNNNLYSASNGYTTNPQSVSLRARSYRTYSPAGGLFPSSLSGLIPQHQPQENSTNANPELPPLGGGGGGGGGGGASGYNNNRHAPSAAIDLMGLAPVPSGDALGIGATPTGHEAPSSFVHRTESDGAGRGVQGGAGGGKMGGTTVSAGGRTFRTSSADWAVQSGHGGGGSHEFAFGTSAHHPHQHLLTGGGGGSHRSGSGVGRKGANANEAGEGKEMTNLPSSFLPSPGASARDHPSATRSNTASAPPQPPAAYAQAHPSGMHHMHLNSNNPNTASTPLGIGLFSSGTNSGLGMGMGMGMGGGGGGMGGGFLPQPADNMTSMGTFTSSLGTEERRALADNTTAAMALNIGGLGGGGGISMRHPHHNAPSMQQQQQQQGCTVISNHHGGARGTSSSAATSPSSMLVGSSGGPQAAPITRPRDAPSSVGGEGFASPRVGGFGGAASTQAPIPDNAFASPRDDDDDEDDGGGHMRADIYPKVRRESATAATGGTTTTTTKLYPITTDGVGGVGAVVANGDSSGSPAPAAEGAINSTLIAAGGGRALIVGDATVLSPSDTSATGLSVGSRDGAGGVGTSGVAPPTSLVPNNVATTSKNAGGEKGLTITAAPESPATNALVPPLAASSAPVGVATTATANTTAVAATPSAATQGIALRTPTRHSYDPSRPEDVSRRTAIMAIPLPFEIKVDGQWSQAGGSSAHNVHALLSPRRAAAVAAGGDDASAALNAKKTSQQVTAPAAATATAAAAAQTQQQPQPSSTARPGGRGDGDPLHGSGAAPSGGGNLGGLVTLAPRQGTANNNQHTQQQQQQHRGAPNNNSALQQRQQPNHTDVPVGGIGILIGGGGGGPSPLPGVGFELYNRPSGAGGRNQQQQGVRNNRGGRQGHDDGESSFDNVSAIAAKAARRREAHNLPIFFADSSLVDRDITVVHLNVIMFHQYARRRHPMSLTNEYAEFITYIHAEVKRFGGVLESFFGDKVWVSFNATSKCNYHQIAASYFAFHVTTVINNAALRYLGELAQVPENAHRSEMPTGDPRFSICRYGVNCGVATGRAFVGPLGNSSIKRHSIISNAVSEAAALERLSLRYPGVNAMIGGDMIPAIEGYCQYLLVDATLLPGSNGKRRRVACLKGPMLSPSADPNVVKRWLVRRKGGLSQFVQQQQKMLQQRQQLIEQQEAQRRQQEEAAAAEAAAKAAAEAAAKKKKTFLLSGPSMASMAAAPPTTTEGGGAGAGAGPSSHEAFSTTTAPPTSFPAGTSMATQRAGGGAAVATTTSAPTSASAPSGGAPNFVCYVTVYGYDIEDNTGSSNSTSDDNMGGGSTDESQSARSRGTRNSGGNKNSNNNASGRNNNGAGNSNKNGGGSGGKGIKGTSQSRGGGAAAANSAHNTSSNTNSSGVTDTRPLLVVPSVNKYRTLNESFNAVLEGQNSVAQQLLYTVATEIQYPDIATAETEGEFAERRAIVDFMAQLVQTFLTNGIDGRTYKSTLGEMYQPFSHVLAVSSNVRVEL